MARKPAPNDLFRAARERLPSPSGAPRSMSRQELADAVNAYLYREHKITEKLNQDHIGKIERGHTGWPGEWRRLGLRAVLGAASDTELGFYFHRTTRGTEPHIPGGGDLRSPQDSGADAGPLPVLSVLPGVGSQEVVETNRRQALTHWLGAAAGLALAGIEHRYAGGVRGTDQRLLASYTEVGEALAGLYRTVDPQAVLPVAATFADHLIDLYHHEAGAAGAGELARLVVDTHCQVGLWACHAHRLAQAHRYLATACEVAAGLEDPPLQSRSLGALAYLHSSALRGGSGGNPQRALELLDQALNLAANADGFTRGWLATWRADQHATLGHLAQAQADVEEADTALDAGDDRSTGGFFARRHYGYGMRGHLDSVRGLVHALAGDLDESDRVFATVQARAANQRRRIATSSHQALGQAKAANPEAACSALSWSISQAVAEPYPMGLKRAAGVRAGFDPAWDRLPCVRDLDQQLTTLVPASG